jgi:hypothetical protein
VKALAEEHKLQEAHLPRQVSLEPLAMVLHIVVAIPIMKVVVVVVATTAAAMAEIIMVVAADRATSHY